MLLVISTAQVPCTAPDQFWSYANVWWCVDPPCCTLGLPDTHGGTLLTPYGPGVSCLCWHAV